MADYDLPPIIPAHDAAAAARMAGFEWGDIQQHVDDGTQDALAAGYSPREIDDHLGFQSSTALHDRLAAQSQVALADPGATEHPHTVATLGLAKPSVSGQPPEPGQSINPLPAPLRQQYAMALTDGEVKGPEDFAATFGAATGGSVPHINHVTADLTSQLPRPEDVTDAAIGAVHASGHDITPGLVAIAREHVLDQWVAGADPLQTLRAAQANPSVADALTRPKPDTTPPPIPAVEPSMMANLAGAIEPSMIAESPDLAGATAAGLDKVGKALGILSLVPLDFATTIVKAAMIPGEVYKGEVSQDQIPAQARDFALTFGLLKPVAPEGALSAGMPLRLSDRFMALTDAGATPAEAAAKVVDEHIDGLAGDHILRQTLGTLPKNPRNFAAASIRFNRGASDREVQVVRNRLDQYVKATEKALPAHLETIEKVRQAGGFAKYLDGGGKLDDISTMKLYTENRTRLGLQNPFKEDHPLYGLADIMRDAYQGVRDRLEANPLFDGMGFHEDYYRHLWKNPERADQLFGVGREGSRASLNARHIPTEMQGIERGLNPAVPNPIANTLHYIDGLLKYEANLNTLAMGRTAGHIRWSANDLSPPVKGWERLKGRTANTARRWSRDARTPGTALVPLGERGLSTGGAHTFPGEHQLLEWQNDHLVEARANISGELPKPPGTDVAPIIDHLPAVPGRELIRPPGIETAGEIPLLGGPAPRGPEGYEMNDATATTNPARPPPVAMKKLVSYAWAHPGYARAYNSWVGRGFYDHRWLGPIYHGLQYSASMSTGMKLAFSAYHLINIAAETSIAGVARAFGKLPRGELISGLSDIGMSGAVMPEMSHMIKLGNALESAYLRTGGSPLDQKLADLFSQAGGRVGGRQGVYRIDARDNLWRAFRQGKLANELRADLNKIKTSGALAPLHTTKTGVEYVARAIDTLNGPLFDKMIPKIKQGAWAAEMSDFLRRNPGADPGVQLTRARQVMDSLDDRFGEMNQDNLFWNRYAKQAMNLFTVSVGWEYGTLRAFGHAALDIATGHWGSTRARWLPAFLAMTAFMNSAYQYLHTGTLPHSATGLFLAPKTGGTLPSGDPERAVLPGYQKELIRAATEALMVPDFVGALQAVGGYAKSKLNPFWQTVAKLTTDQDWDQTSLRLKYEAAHGAPPWWWETLGGLAKDMIEPIAAGNLAQERVGTAIPGWERFMGARPAGLDLSNPQRFEAIMAHIHARKLEQERSREEHYNATLETPDPDIPPPPPPRARGSSGGDGYHPYREPRVRTHRTRKPRGGYHYNPNREPMGP